jgi:hypothetical protein
LRSFFAEQRAARKKEIEGGFGSGFSDSNSLN